MTEPAIFFRLLRAEDKARALRESIAKVNEGDRDRSIHHVDPETFGAVPDSAFAYWVSDRVREVFRKLPKFERTVGEARQGLATADDFRFVRASWEVSEDRIARVRQETLVPPRGAGKRWAAFAKGGEFSPYWSDVHLVVNWWNDGEELKAWAGTLYNNSHWSRIIKNVDFYFRPGITWPSRTGAWSPRALPAGCAFGHKGSTVFTTGDDEADLFLALAVMCSRTFDMFVSIRQGREELARSFEVGLVQTAPWPAIPGGVGGHLCRLARRCHDLTRSLATRDETSAVCIAPLLARPAPDLKSAYLDALAEIDQARAELADTSAEADRLVLDLYEIGPEDRERIDQELGVLPGSLPRTPLALGDHDFTRLYLGTEDVLGEGDEDADEDGERSRRARRSYRSLGALARELHVHPAVVAARRRELGLLREDELAEAVHDLLMYCVGCAFGRWDVRIAADRSRAPSLPGAFEPMPLLASGRLRGADGAPAGPEAIPDDYPIRSVARSGVLSDADLTLAGGRSGDLVAVVREILAHLFGERADEIEGEAVRCLGARDLRTYLRTRFFAWHLGRYSKSRRKAPIYWPLQSDRKSLTLWLYAPRVNAQTIYVALKDFLGPKALIEETRLRELRQQRQAGDLPRREQARLDREIDRQQDLLVELGRLKAVLEEIAALGYDPDPDDGIVINVAPLREVLPLWPEARRMWQELTAGKYAWSRMSGLLKGRGLVREGPGG